MNRFTQFLSNYRNAIFAWLSIIFLLGMGLYFEVDEAIIGLVIVIVGILGQAFAALLAWIAFIPVIGPIIAKVVALPFFWILNGIGYLASIVAIRKGYSKEVINYRILTVTLLIGVTIGYILGKLI